jgi:hypothetical protein
VSGSYLVGTCVLAALVEIERRQARPIEEGRKPELKRTPVDLATVVTLARAARLQLGQARAEELAGTMDVVFGLLDRLDEVALGETALAFAYRAKWTNAEE